MVSPAICVVNGVLGLRGRTEWIMIHPGLPRNGRFIDCRWSL